MVNSINEHPEWVTKGKTIRQLIEELQTFENQDIEVLISIDNGENCQPISLVGKEGEERKYCLLVNCK